MVAEPLAPQAASIQQIYATRVVGGLRMFVPRPLPSNGLAVIDKLK
jgi:hypothetical protein